MWWMIALARGGVLLAETLLALPLLYLVILSVAALQGRRSVAQRERQRNETLLDVADVATLAPIGRQAPRFAILLPAHNEAAVITDALASVQALDYPPDRYDAIVIADNCDDATASLARAAGAIVYEHIDATQKAKGYALRWMIDQLLQTQQPDAPRYDAFVVVDADSRLSRNFLRRMAEILANGALVAQAQYRVHNGADGWAAGLRAVAFALFNHLRPLGRMRLGWSAGLKGNGMVFQREVFERFGWASYSLTEDAEYHISLVKAGIHVAYAPDAIVSSEMPTTLRQSGTQQARWERGRVELARAHMLPLLRDFIRTRDGALLDAAMEIALPPLSLVVGLIGLCLICSLALWWGPAVGLALALGAALAIHVVVGATLAGLTFREYLSLARAPLYIGWKCWVYLLALLTGLAGRAAAPWVRTQRVAEALAPTQRASSGE